MQLFIEYIWDERERASHRQSNIQRPADQGQSLWTLNTKQTAKIAYP